MDILRYSSNNTINYGREMNFLRTGRFPTSFGQYFNTVAFPSLFLPSTPLDLRLKLLIRKHIELYAFSNAEYFQKDENHDFKPELIVDKVFTRRKGMCMELNFAFGILLDNLGYDVRFVKCFKPHHDSYFTIFHLGIIVGIKEEGDEYFVDVGFGEYFREPIPMDHNRVTDGVRIEKVGDSFDVWDNKKNSLIFRIKSDPVNVETIQENIALFYKSGPADFPLCKGLYQRIYDAKTESFIEFSNLKAKL